MAIDGEFLAKLRCPRTGTPLRTATSAELERVNAAVRSGGVRNFGGEELSEPLSAGLVPEGAEIVYPVQQGIPVLLGEYAIRLDGADPESADRTGDVPELSGP